ncbi:MAG TPA: helix-turn-helix domain-containing protein [Candidatus Obscuribacter sp.]|nr:helix-turn-helix domain-containing protein [Candidatus Melainabacteria bacterium]HNG74853.1 helix-turn-helix domain-containing protein [Candidatus Obscuribacter sp.]
MPEEAHKLTSPATVDTTGLEDFFSSRDKADPEDLTLEEAAKRLNLSERTVQRRLKHGQLIGYKVSGPRGPEWRIKLESCEDTTLRLLPTSDDTTFSSEDTTDVESVSSEDMTDDNRTAAAHAYVQFTDFYKDQIETLQEKLEAATYRNGYLEAQLSNAETQLKLLPDLSAKAIKTETLEQQIGRLEAELATARQSWWVRFGRWFIGKK